MAAKALTVLFNNLKTAVLCLALVLFMCKVVSSHALNYHVNSLDDTRKVMLSYSSGTSSPSNSYLRIVDEIEKSVYDAQATRTYYRQSSARLKKIEGIIKVAANATTQGSSHFIRQSLGYALYTVREIEKHSKRRKRRCSLCQDAMDTFMKKIKKDIGVDEYNKFIGNKTMDEATLMFAIDDTGSMHADIQAAKDIATYIVRTRSARPNLKVNYILSPFNDPETGRALTKEVGQGEKFIEEIEKLIPNGGGDCPEMAFTGMIKALDESPEHGSPLYVFTDASAKDATFDNVGYVSTVASGKGINVYFFLSGSCGDDDRSFKELATQTCGQVFELPKSSSELAKMKRVTKNLLGGAVCLPAFSFRPRGRRATLRGYNLQVDDTMDKIIVSVSSERSGSQINIELRSPVGASVTSGKIRVGKVTIFEVDHPRPGIWNLIVPSAAGKHTHMFKASSKTNMDFAFIFVIPRLHGSPIPISYPLTGKLAHVILIVRATDKIQPASLSLNIVGEDGEVLNTTSVIPVGTSGAHFSATFSTPSVPFKLQLQGRTKGNFNFQRNSQSTVTPRHVVVKVLYARNEFTVPISGYEFTIFFAYNTGPTEVFDFKVRSTTNFEAQSSRSSARIYRDRMAFFSVRFTATPSAVRGAADRMLVTVTGRTTRVTASYLVSLMVI